MTRLFLLVLSVAICFGARAGDVVFNLTDFTTTPQQVRALSLFPTGAPFTNGAGAIITRDWQTRSTGTNGSVTIPTVYGGDYRSELVGSKTTTTNWYRFPVTNGTLNASDWITVPTNSPSGGRAWTTTEADGRYVAKNDGLSLTNIAGGNVDLVWSTGTTAVTNGHKVTVTAAASAGGGRTLYVATNGNNATALVNDITHPWADPYAASTNALRGDAIIIGRGWYNVSNTIVAPTNGAIIGTGNPNLTLLSNWVATANGPCIRPSDGSQVSDLLIVDGDAGVSGFRLPIGVNNDGPGAKGFKFTRVNTLGWTDGLEIQTTNTCTGIFEYCTFKGNWDFVIISDSLRTSPCHNIDFVYCDLINTNYGRTSSAHALTMFSNGGRLNMYGGTMDLAANYQTISCGDFADNIISNATVNLYGVSIKTLATQPAMDSDPSQNCFIRIFGGVSEMAASDETSFGVTNQPSSSLYGAKIISTNFIGNGASLTNLNATQLLSGTVPAARMPALTGDATSSAGSVALTLKNTGTAGTYAKTTFDAQGREISGTTLSAGDIPAIPESGVTSLLTDLSQRATTNDARSLSFSGSNWLTGILDLENELRTTNSPGTVGQVLTSRGSGASPFWSTAGSLGSLAMPMPRSRRNSIMMASGSTSSTGQSLGDQFLTMGGTVTVVSPTSVYGASIAEACPSSAAAQPFGRSGNINYRYGRNCYYYFAGYLGTNASFNFAAGLTDLAAATTMGALARPIGNYAAFIFSPTNGDTAFQCVTCDNSAVTVKSSGVTTIATTRHTFEIYMNDSIPNVVFYIDGTSVATNTTHLPSSGTGFRYMAGCQSSTIPSPAGQAMIGIEQIMVGADF